MKSRRTSLTLALAAMFIAAAGTRHGDAAMIALQASPTPAPTPTPLPTPAPSPTPAAKFTDRAASDLLAQITNGFTGRNREKVLGTFDLAAMPDGERFRQQIISFFSHSESVRIHFNLVKTSGEEGKGMAEVQVEMEATPRQDNAPTVHKQERLRFTAASTSAGWKFIEVEPRAFFSLQP